MKKSEQTDKVLITYLLKHQQDKTLDQITTHLSNTKFWELFPPKEVEIINWQVLVGKGHMITLSCNPLQIRELNLIIEKSVWGAFDTETYITYDYTDVWKSKRKKQ